MKKHFKYYLIFILTFLLYGNTLFHDFALDDAIVITENEFTLSGFDGIDDLFKEEMFDGFFEQKDKKLVAGGRYRPLSVVSFAIEWQIIMGTPFDGLNKLSIEKRLNQNVNTKFILPSQKLLKDLSKTIHTENINTRRREQNRILLSYSKLTKQEKATISKNLVKMQKSRKTLLFVSHFVNVLFFALTCLVLFILLELLFKNGEMWYLSLSFVATLIFLVHPIHTEVIANIKGRDEIMSLLGALFAMLFSFKYFEKQKVIYLIWIFLSFLGGLFSKEIAITFVVIIPLSIYFFSDKKFKTGIITFIPLAIASLIYFYIRSRVIGGMSFEPSAELMNNSFLGMSFSEKYATIFYTLLLYLKLLIFPHPLTYDYYPYHIPVMEWSNIWPIVSLLVYLFLGVYALLNLKKKKLIAFGILFYLIALAPTSNVFFPIGVFMNERFVYVASIGIILILAFTITELIPQRLKNKSSIQYILIGMLVLYSFKTISRNSNWKNDFTLFTHDVKISSNSAKSNTSAGGKLIEEAVKPKNTKLKEKYLKQAIVYLKKAVNIHPTYSDAYLLLGNAQWELYQNLDSTFKYYERILLLDPKYKQVYANIFESKISRAFDIKENALNNIEILHKLEAYNPNHYKLNYYMGRIYGQFLNDIPKSIKYLEKASNLNEKDFLVYKDLGVVYGISKEYLKSAEALTQANKLKPNDPVLKFNLAMTYANLSDFNSALKLMDELLIMDIGRENANILISIGNMYHNFGSKQKAQESFKKAKEINPDLFINKNN